MSFQNLEQRSFEMMLEQEGLSVTYYVKGEDPSNSAHGESRTVVWLEDRGKIEDDDMNLVWERMGLLDVDDGDTVDQDGRFKIRGEVWHVIKQHGRDSASITWVLGLGKVGVQRRTRSRG